MSTENTAPQVTNDEPVVVLDDKKYVISELSQEAQYYVASLNNLGVKRQNIQMELDQVAVASEGFTSRLKDVIDNPPEEEMVDAPVEEG